MRNGGRGGGSEPEFKTGVKMKITKEKLQELAKKKDDAREAWETWEAYWKAKREYENEKKKKGVSMTISETQTTFQDLWERHAKRLGLTPALRVLSVEDPINGYIMSFKYLIDHRTMREKVSVNNIVSDFFRVLETDIMDSPAFRDIFDKQKEEIEKLKKLNEELQKYKTHFDMEVKKEREVNHEKEDNVIIDLKSNGGVREQGHQSEGRSSKPEPEADGTCPKCGFTGGEHHHHCLFNFFV